MKRRTVRRSRKAKNLVFALIFVGVVLLAVGVARETGKAQGVFSDIDFLGFFGQSASAEQGWNLMLVNRDSGLPRNYDVELTELSNGERVDSRIYPALQKMFDDARAHGIYPTVASGYRTASEQRGLMDDKVEEFISQGYSKTDAKAEARKWVAEVGYSEHQTGLAIDINADGVNSTGWQVYNWLADNAWKYGFILRYPEDKTELTYTDYEPWHYRYVGLEAAAEIYEQGLCLEEYLDEGE